VPFVSRITVAQSSSARAQYRSSAARCTDRSKRQSRSGRVKPHHCRLNAARLTSGGRSQSWVSARAPRCRRRVQPRVSRPFASRLSSSATPKGISPIPNRDTQVSCETGSNTIQPSHAAESRRRFSVCSSVSVKRGYSFRSPTAKGHTRVRPSNLRNRPLRRAQTCTQRELVRVQIVKHALVGTAKTSCRSAASGAIFRLDPIRPTPLVGCSGRLGREFWLTKSRERSHQWSAGSMVSSRTATEGVWLCRRCARLDEVRNSE
jgi:hypothetical protein